MTAMDAVPLRDAVLCAECEVISRIGGDACPMCGSRSLLCLARVLGGSVGASRTAIAPAHQGPAEIREVYAHVGLVA